MNNNLGAIVLAAGKGSRIKAKNINKVAMSLAGRPIISHAVKLLRQLGVKDIVVVVGFAKESVISAIDDKVIFAEQKRRLGTAHAAYCGLKKVPKAIHSVLILNGDDSAFYAVDLVKKLIETHFSSNAALTFLTVERENPESFGRVVRDESGALVSIAEEKDATDFIKKIKEINAGCYVARVDFLAKYLPKVKKNAISGEYYLTDLIGIGLNNNEKIVDTRAGEIAWWGINTAEELQEAEKYKNAHLSESRN